MFSNWMNDLQVNDEQGAECTFDGVSLESKNHLKRFESIHTILCGLEEQKREGVLVSDVCTGADIGFYQSFCPESTLKSKSDLQDFIDKNLNDFVANILNLFPSEDLPNWASLGIESKDVTFYGDTVTIRCTSCNDLFDMECDASLLCEIIDGNMEHCVCGKSNCMP